MRIFKKVALALVGTALTGAAHATPITYTLSGHVSGSLFIGVVTENFSDVPLLWTVGSNTNTSSIVDTHGGPTIEMTALSDRIDLGGTVLVPSIPTVFAAASVPVFPGNPVAFGIGGFVDTTALMGLAWHAPALFGYAGTTSIGPLAVVFDNTGSLPVGAQTLSITGGSGLVFQAFLDEPPMLPSFVIAIAAGAAILGVARRRAALRE